jgi:hypothetical protein
LTAVFVGNELVSQKKFHKTKLFIIHNKKRNNFYRVENKSLEETDPNWILRRNWKKSSKFPARSKSYWQQLVFVGNLLVHPKNFQKNQVIYYTQQKIKFTQ